MQELAEQIESLKNLLIARATGEGGDEAQYKTLRKTVIDDPKIKDIVPRFVRTCTAWENSGSSSNTNIPATRNGGSSSGMPSGQ